MNGMSYESVLEENRVLLGRVGHVQRHCGDLIQQQAAEIERLRAQVMRLRGELIVRQTALAFAHEERQVLEAAVPGLPKRAALARRVDTLMKRVQELMRELRTRPGEIGVAGLPDLHSCSVLCVGDAVPEFDEARRMVERTGGVFVLHRLKEEGDVASLESSLAAADLVICQTGCVSHDAYWLVQDHCRRTGKRCVLVGKP